MTRFPRIGRGKHNIHFDPHESEYHDVLIELADACHISDILSYHTKKQCCIRESGLTVTHPQLLLAPQHLSTVANSDDDCNTESQDSSANAPIATSASQYNKNRAYGSLSSKLTISNLL